MTFKAFLFGTTFAAAVLVACGTTTTNVDGGADAATQPTQVTTHDCSPACGSTKYCAYPLSPGFCPPPNSDGGICPAGCPTCPSLPAPSCTALPAACNGTPTCDCLLTACPGGCGSVRGTCAIDADGDWVIRCDSC